MHVSIMIIPTSNLQAQPRTQGLCREANKPWVRGCLQALIVLTLI
jgi:hypothetical protein